MRGDIDRARGECDEAHALAEQTTYVIAIRAIAVARCLAELSVDNVAAAWQAAELLLDQLSGLRGTWEPGALLFLPDALEALIALGELDRAGVMLDMFQQRAKEVDRVWAVATGERCRGLLLAAQGDLVGGAAHLQRALIDHQRLDMPFELARTLLCVGRLERRRKQRKSARSALSRSAEIFDRLGTPRWAAKARAELERTHLREAPGNLSPTELRVAELAASGLTNRRISERLFISPKTVEANLARAYTKLGIRSRAELGARMAAFSDTPAEGDSPRRGE
jgi:DNA-binding CsgD family transcriptional regulator